jgi:hypothetical protein
MGIYFAAERTRRGILWMSSFATVCTDGTIPLLKWLSAGQQRTLVEIDNFLKILLPASITALAPPP